METQKSSNCRRAGLDLGFSAEEKEKLRELAFHAIRSRCLGMEMPDIEVDSPRLKEPGAAFVCIHRGGELRGCIGMIEARAPLWEAIRRMAVEAAFGDPRFCALASDELDEIDIEISVLTPLCGSAIFRKSKLENTGFSSAKALPSGLLLPQVATEHNLDRERFLKLTCRKAGLPETAWKSKDTEIYVFSADVFRSQSAALRTQNERHPPGHGRGGTSRIEVFKWPGF